MAESMVKDKKFYHNKWNRSSHLDSLIKTGFELQQRGLVVVDTINGLMWQQSGSDTIMKFEEVEGYIRRLNEQTFAGFSAWRLPTLEEAMSLTQIDSDDRKFIHSWYNPRDVY